MQHIVLTRFSYRGARVNTSDDPLDPDRLQRRMHLFETITAPSLASQSRQDFTWVVIVDPALPDTYRARLHAMADSHEAIRIQVYDRTTNVDALGWLGGHGLRPDTRWVLTTNLDDDDALTTNYVASVRSEAEGDLDREPPVTLFGASAAREWRFRPQPGLPVGTIGPWQRSLPVSAGLSLLTDRSALDVSVLAMRHRDALLYGSSSLPGELPPFRRRRIEHVHPLISDQLGSRPPSQFYRPLQTTEAEALMVTHLDNVQAGRLFQNGQPRLDAVDQLARFGVDVDIAAIIAQHMRLDWRNAFGQARRLYRADTWPIERPRPQHRVRLGWSAGRRVLSEINEPAVRSVTGV